MTAILDPAGLDTWIPPHKFHRGRSVFTIEVEVGGEWLHHSSLMRLYTGPTFMDYFDLHMREALFTVDNDPDRVRISHARIH